MLMIPAFITAINDDHRGLIEENSGKESLQLNF